MVTIIQISKDELKAEIKSAIDSALSEFHAPIRDRLLSREEASLYLGVSLPTLNSWEKSGQLTPKRYGNRVYFLESNLLSKK